MTFKGLGFHFELLIVFQVHEDPPVAVGIEELPLVPLEIGFVNLVAGAKGLLQHLGGDQVAVFGFDHGVGTARRR